MAPTRTELIDLFWRSLWTFIAAFTGGEVINGLFNYDLAALQLAALSGGGAVITLLKTYASNKLGTGTATEKTSAPAGLPQPVASNFATPAGTP